MKLFKRTRQIWRGALQGVHLVDRCLMVMMLVLLLQSTYSLFANNVEDSSANNIDIIVRTSAAGIFGYFLSGNFDSRRPTPSGMQAEDSTTGSTTGDTTGSTTGDSTGKIGARLGVSNQIGFNAQEGAAGKSDKDQAMKSAPTGFLPNTQAPGGVSRLQILVAFSVGMFCLLVLIFLRNIARFATGMSASQDVLATASQFRDFVSGCVGFLLGCPTGGKGNSN